MTLEFDNKYGDGYDLIERGSSILAFHGYHLQAQEIHQIASIHGYNFYICLKLLKNILISNID